MLPPDLLDGIDPSELPNEGLIYLAKRLGSANLIKIWNDLRGRKIEIPNNIPHKILTEWIKKHSDMSVAEMAWQLGISKRTIHRLLDERPNHKRQSV